MLESVFYWFVAVGLAFDLFGCIGLIRLPDVYNRAQAATKCVTLGTCLILTGLAGLALTRGNGAMCIKALLCAAFILLTSPTGAHALVRGAYLSGLKLWEGSVEDAFADRAERIRNESSQPASPASPEEGVTHREEAETA